MDCTFFKDCFNCVASTLRCMYVKYKNKSFNCIPRDSDYRQVILWAFNKLDCENFDGGNNDSGQNGTQLSTGLTIGVWLLVLLLVLGLIFLLYKYFKKNPAQLPNFHVNFRRLLPINENGIWNWGARRNYNDMMGESSLSILNLGRPRASSSPVQNIEMIPMKRYVNISPIKNPNPNVTLNSSDSSTIINNEGAGTVDSSRSILHNYDDSQLESLIQNETENTVNLMDVNVSIPATSRPTTRRQTGTLPGPIVRLDL